MSTFTKEEHTEGKMSEKQLRKRKADVSFCLQDPDENIESKAMEMPKKRPYEDICLKFQTSVYSSLPQLSSAEADNMWQKMLSKDTTYPRDKNFLQRHPDIQERMRAILLDWLMEVCDLHKLRRETFYLAKDFFDRFMTTEKNIAKTKLQLIGISCLFIAAKVEEICPPRLCDFADVTDEACTSNEILQMELIIMKALKWLLSPNTAFFWLIIYLQIACSPDMQLNLQSLCPQHKYMQAVRLLDLCVLDVQFLEYPCSILAASVLCHFYDAKVIEELSGYTWTDIENCTKHMLPFAMAIKDIEQPAEVCYNVGVTLENLHTIQNHKGGLDLLLKAQNWKKQLKDRNSSTQ